MADFISRISVVCFAASYGVALIFEASRLWFRSGVRGITMIGFVTAGLVAHSLYLIWRSTTLPSIPLSSEFDWYLLAAWLFSGWIALDDRL